MQKQGLPIHMRPPGGRARPDGQVLHWQSATLEGSMSPFFIQDVAPRRLRVPDDSEKVRHANGVSGVTGIQVAVAHLENGIARYSAILGVSPQQQDATTADFALGVFTLTLTVPTDDDDPLQAYLAQHGETPYQLWLSSEPTQPTPVLNPELTHGAQLDIKGVANG
jgi:hypothetical protein